MRNRIVFFIVTIVVLAGLIIVLNRPKHDEIKIGIIEPIVHIAVSDITQGIQDHLDQSNPERFVVLVRNASSDASTIPQIIAQYKDAGVDIFVPIFTQTAQATKSTIDDKVIIFAAVTDPVAAGLLIDPTEPEGNITGASDLWPIAAQFDLIQQILPNFKRLGILFDPNDPSSSITMPLIREQANNRGIEIVDRPVYSIVDVAQALPVFVGNVDCIFTANDVTVTEAFPALVAFAIEHQIPLFAGDYSSVQRGAIGAIGQNYYNVGREAGELILEASDGVQVAQLPVRYTEGGDLYLNIAASEAMGVTIPDSLISIAKETYFEISDGTLE